MNRLKSMLGKAFIFHSLLSLGMIEASAGSGNAGLATAPNQTIAANGIQF